MATVHLVYPHGTKISCPDAIGRNLGKRLTAAGFQVCYYDFDDIGTIYPGTDDVLLGHAHPNPKTLFRQSMKQAGWRRILILEPYVHRDHQYVAFLDRIMNDCALFLAITGNFWFTSIEQSLFAHWRPKMKHLDLAVERYDFPILKMAFQPCGKRRFLYIGHIAAYKNTEYLSHIALQMPEIGFSHIGNGHIYGVTALGVQDFAMNAGKQKITEHDFLLTVGRADANPTTILEAMAWGLIPVCTPQSGYINYSGIVNVPLNNISEAVRILRHLQEMPADKLHEMQRINWNLIEEHFNWDRFAHQVIDAIHSTESPPLKSISRFHRVQIRWAEFMGSRWMIWPQKIGRFLRRLSIR